MSIELEHGSATHIGQRRSENQDFFKIHKRKKLFVVADGMGGHEYGELAAKIAANTVSKHFNPKDVKMLSNAVIIAHGKIKAKARQISQKTRVRKVEMGTTLTALHISKAGNAHFAHVGDSRLYRFVNGHLEQLTEDHTVENDFLKAGIIQKGDPVDLYIKNALAQALGFKNIVPQTGIHEVEPGHVYLLCSDGLTKHVDDDEIETMLQKVRDGQMHSQQAADKLVEMANSAGGHDNITILIIRALHKKS